MQSVHTKYHIWCEIKNFNGLNALEQLISLACVCLGVQCMQTVCASNELLILVKTPRFRCEPNKLHNIASNSFIFNRSAAGFLQLELSQYQIHGTRHIIIRILKRWMGIKSCTQLFHYLLVLANWDTAHWIVHHRVIIRMSYSRQVNFRAKYDSYKSQLDTNQSSPCGIFIKNWGKIK